jgi:hypothetical protein
MNSTTIDPRVNCTIDHDVDFAPTAEDLADYSAYLAGRSDLDVQAVEPTPVELLDAPIDPEDLDDDGMPWWLSLPESPELDTPIELGPEAAPIAAKARFRVEVAGEPDTEDDGFFVVDKETGYPVRWERHFGDAERHAAERNREAIRSRASNWNPEADLADDSLIDHLGRCEYPA